ncbi:hypothetical protein [Oenococcus oeni]|uniref:hypothetical protein n=1 Tax=Oenococcus oeni TaxID=1247 RepID=UPI0010B39295|nr:hypothetical protein [Oenococcus oeni]SYW13391.1 hypothetical protein OENI_120011 [Oenococcus oeni]
MPETNNTELTRYTISHDLRNWQQNNNLFVNGSTGCLSNMAYQAIKRLAEHVILLDNSDERDFLFVLPVKMYDQIRNYFEDNDKVLQAFLKQLKNPFYVQAKDLSY